MTDRPIIFSAPMMRALLDGRKTQTRRVLKPQPTEDIGISLAENPLRFAVGDRLWVRETFSGLYEYESDPPSEWFHSDPIWWWADGNPGDGDWTRPRSSIHMPRWASRLTLAVTDVRVERLQDISEADSLAEGIDDLWLVQHRVPPPRRSSYRDLWNSLHGPDAWAANPWIVAISFTVERRNIDATGERLSEVDR